MKCFHPIELLRDNKSGSPYRLDLFKEIRLSGANNLLNGGYGAPLYTLDTIDKDGLISAHRVYMESTSEYEVAIKLLGSWKHWQAFLKRSKKLREVIEGWRDEKDLLDKTRAKSLLWESAKKGSVPAQKALYEYRKQEIRKEKAQTKVSIAEEQEQAESERQTELLKERLARLGPKLING